MVTRNKGFRKGNYLQKDRKELLSVREMPYTLIVSVVTV